MHGKANLAKIVAETTAKPLGLNLSGLDKFVGPDYRSLNVGRIQKYALVNKLSIHSPCKRVCVLFHVSRSAYYAYCQKREHKTPAQRALEVKLADCFHESQGAAGSRTLVFRLHALGFSVGRYKIRRLMKRMGLVSRQPKATHRYTSITNAELKFPNHLDRQFSSVQANQIWLGDITYIGSGSCWSYLSVVMDLYTRRIIGWAMSEKADTGLVLRSLEMAWVIRYHPVNVLFHSD